MKINLLLLFGALFILTANSMAQLPADLSKVKSSQISDQQLTQIAQQAKNSGQSEQAVLQELKQRGLPDTEIQALVARISGLMQTKGAEGSTTFESQVSKDRKLTTPTTPSEIREKKSTSKVFGAELFQEASPIFAPNLSIATPLNYRVGPGDELLLEVFGTNVFSQKAQVSREGFVNVRYAGLVNVNGITIEEVATLLKSKLSKYLPSLTSGGSRLQVNLGNIRSINVSVVGAVKKPGTLTLPSLATLFNALYATGGPLENGSFRNIELIRGNKKIITADLYDYLMRGDQSSNIFLQDNDLIRVPFTEHQIQVAGLLNREGIYELKPTETFANALQYAGGFKAGAYQGRVTGTRLGKLAKEIIDIPAAQFTAFALQNGDSLYVDSLVNKYLNRITIKGAVFKPGVYAWQKGQQLAEVIEKAAGLKEEAFLGRATILRTYENQEKENISVDLKAVLKGGLKFELLNEDQITIYSTYELKDRFAVSINGEVRNPGIFPFADSITLQQLILLAGGFTDRAIPTSIEVARQKKLVDVMQLGASSSELILVSLSTDLTKVGADFYLQPNDIILVKADPSKKPQITVRVSGQVLFPGTYTLESQQDRLSALITRAGGLLPNADKVGIKLIRKTNLADTSELKQIIKKQTKTNQDSALAQSQGLNNTQSTEIAVEWEDKGDKNNSQSDIILQAGDEIIIPQLKNTITLTGEVLKPVSVQYLQNKSFRYYISAAGGFSAKAKKGKSFVVYSNGRSKRAGSFLGLFRTYPKILPGSTVVVPAKSPRDGRFDPSKAGILVSALTTLATTIAILKGL
jgi:protein involved in polysaccharide export with SLBB domain